MRSALCLLFVAASFILGVQAFAQPPQRLEFRRMVAHWDQYGHDDYLPFISEAQPEVVQVGFYGAHFWSLVHTPAFGGYPSHFPVQGLKECGDWFEKRNRELHERGCKVVGHFNVEFLVGDPESPEGPRGFFKFYRDLWDEKELGPRPTPNPLDLLEKNADGTPISQSGYGIGGMKEYWACLRNPHWQAVMKAWVKRGVERGVDGYIANYFYRHNCLCEHCQRDFRAYLRERFAAGDLKDRFGIENLDQHQFTELVSWHDPKESTPLRREMLRWSQISNKRVFDEVFIHYGRSLKKDLIVAQWNHIGSLHQISGDERCLLPAELWGKDEDYLWYSTGGAAYRTDLAKGDLGEGTLQARFIRSMFDDKPFTLGKYESTRIRAAIAELAANGGAPMGFYTRFTDPFARAEIARYYQFLKKHDDIFRASRPHAEAVLIFPRTKVFEGDLEAVEQFKAAGNELLDRHVLFDVLSDEPAFDARRKDYPQVVASPLDIERNLNDAAASGMSRFDAPKTVRVSSSRSAAGGDLVFHFVNYNRTEPPPDNEGRPGPGSGIADEKPIAVEPFACDVLLPAGVQVQAVEFLTPESQGAVPIPFQAAAGRVQFKAPGFLVYGVARMKLRGP